MASTATKAVLVGAAGVGAYLLYRTYSAKNASPYPSGLAPWADQTALGYPAPYTGAGGSNPTPAGASPTVSIPMSSIDPSGNTALKIYAMVPPGVPVGFSAQEIYSNPQAAVNGKVEIAPGITVSPLDIWSNTDVSEGQPIEGAVRSGDWCSCASIPLLDATPAMLPGGVVNGQITDYLGRPMSTSVVARTLANGGFCTTPGETMKDAQNDVRFMAWYNALSKVPGGLTLFQQAMNNNQSQQTQAKSQTSQTTQYQNTQTTSAPTYATHSAVVDSSATGSSPLSQMLKVAGINLNSYGISDATIDNASSANGGNVKATLASVLKNSNDQYMKDHADAFATVFARNVATFNLDNPKVSVSIVNPGNSNADVTLHSSNGQDVTLTANTSKNAVIFPGVDASNSAITLAQRPNGLNVALVMSNNAWANANIAATPVSSQQLQQLMTPVAQNPVASLAAQYIEPIGSVNSAWANANMVAQNATTALSAQVLQPVAVNLNNAWAAANIKQVVPAPVTRPSVAVTATPQSGVTYVSPGVASVGNIGWW